MSKRKPKAPIKEDWPKVYETFCEIDTFDIGRSTQSEPSCFNGIVRVTRYRVTVEKIEEPREVIEGRLVKLWRSTDNYHHVEPLRRAAARFGVELDRKQFGADRGLS